MKQNIHPDFKKTEYTCSCSNSFTIYSSIGGKVKLEICSACHPFYTGSQKMVDTEGRIEKFNRRYKK